MSIQGSINSAQQTGLIGIGLYKNLKAPEEKEKREAEAEAKAVSAASSQLNVTRKELLKEEQDFNKRIDEYIDNRKGTKAEVLAGPEDPRKAEEMLQGLSTSRDRIVSKGDDIAKQYQALANTYWNRYMRTADESDLNAYNRLLGESRQMAEGSNELYNFSNSVFQKNKDMNMASEEIINAWAEQRGITDRVQARKDFLQYAKSNQKVINQQYKQYIQDIEELQRKRSNDQWTKGGNK